MLAVKSQCHRFPLFHISSISLRTTTGWFPVPLHSFLLVRMDLLKQSSAFPCFYTLLCSFVSCNMTDFFSVVVQSSPQVAGVPRFRFGPSDDLPQTSSSHSDLVQLPSQGGMYYLMLLNLKELLINCFYCQILVRFLWCLLCFAGLGMYDSSVFLGAHEEESGGRSVPTTPLQIAAPGMYKITHPFLGSYDICSIVTLSYCFIDNSSLIEINVQNRG